MVSYKNMPNKNYKNQFDTMFSVKPLLKKLTIMRSYTCCNIEVSEPNGTEVMCRACGEWCATKGEK